MSWYRKGLRIVPIILGIITQQTYPSVLSPYFATTRPILSFVKLVKSCLKTFHRTIERAANFQIYFFYDYHASTSSLPVISIVITRHEPYQLFYRADGIPAAVRHSLLIYFPRVFVSVFGSRTRRCSTRARPRPRTGIRTGERRSTRYTWSSRITDGTTKSRV